MKWVARILMGLLGLGLLAGLLLGLGVYVAFACIRWLLTGRKPQVVVVWQQFRNLRQNFAQGGFRAGASGAHTAWGSAPGQGQDDQVVDVEVREVKSEPVRLNRPAPPTPSATQHRDDHL